MSSSLWLVFSRASSVSCLWSPPLSFCWACIISGQGVAWALHLYPYVPQHHSRRRQLLFSAACICLGIVWVPLSLTSWSTQGGPLIASILPSLSSPSPRPAAAADRTAAPSAVLPPLLRSELRRCFPLPYFFYQGEALLLHLLRCGSSPPVPPRNTASSQMFQFLLPFYTPCFHCILLDFLGSGRSQRMPELPPQLWIDQGRQAAALIRHLGPWSRLSGGDQRRCLGRPERGAGAP